MIIDLASELNKRAMQPTYTVGIQSYQPAQLEIEILGASIKQANDGFSHLGVPKKEITADEIIFDRQAMEYFRYLLLSITEQMRDGKMAQIAGPSHSRKQSVSDYLRPIFSFEARYDYHDAMRQISKASVPIPHDYLVLLPNPDAHDPARDDIIRALVPFRKAQREALQAGWEDGTSAIRIRHNDVTPRLIVN